MTAPPEPRPPAVPGPDNRGPRLDSWKEIAAYLKRDIRTVQRWEKTANLPVRRLQKAGLRAVFAYAAELDEWLRQHSPTALEGPVAAPAAAPRSRWRLWPAAAAVLSLALAGAAFSLWRFTPAPFGPFTVRPITSDPGSERDPDISPDGKYVAYAFVSPQLRVRLQVRLIDGGEAHAITSAPDNEWSPAWSPDGSRIAFLRGDPAGDATLLLTSALGGEERKVAGVRPYPRRRTQMIGHLLAWTPDGRHLIVTDRAADDRSSLFLINLETGERRQLTSPARAEFDVEPSVSSDGRRLLFNRVRGEYLSDIFVQQLDAELRPAGPPRRLPAAGNWNGTPRLLENRGEVLMCAGGLPRLSLWRQPADGSGKPVSLGIIGDYAVQSAVRRAGGRIVFRTYRSEADIVRFPLPTAPAAAPRMPAFQDFLQSTFIDRSPIYSPDGSQIAFISDRTGRRQLWVSNASGENPVEWTQNFEADLPPPAWSPDGSRILFLGEAPSGRSQLYAADRATRAAVRLTDDGLDYGRALWSDDGKSVFAAAADHGVYAIYRVPAAGGPAEKILPDYRSLAGVEPGGKGLYATRRDRRFQSTLYYVPLPAGAPIRLANMNFTEDAWVTAQGIYYMEQRANLPLAPVALYFRTHAGAVKRLDEYSEVPGRGLSVSPDGRYALTTVVRPPISDLILLQTAR